jgi:Ran GTPase-activating protein (RanGAP) involved in mRNA processing and transport
MYYNMIHIFTTKVAAFREESLLRNFAVLLACRTVRAPPHLLRQALAVRVKVPPPPPSLNMRGGDGGGGGDAYPLRAIRLPRLQGGEEQQQHVVSLLGGNQISPDIYCESCGAAGAKLVCSECPVPVRRPRLGMEPQRPPLPEWRCYELLPSLALVGNTKAACPSGVSALGISHVVCLADESPEEVERKRALRCAAARGRSAQATAASIQKIQAAVLFFPIRYVALDSAAESCCADVNLNVTVNSSNMDLIYAHFLDALSRRRDGGRILFCSKFEGVAAAVAAACLVRRDRMAWRKAWMWALQCFPQEAGGDEQHKMPQLWGSAEKFLAEVEGSVLKGKIYCEECSGEAHPLDSNVSEDSKSISVSKAADFLASFGHRPQGELELAGEPISLEHVAALKSQLASGHSLTTLNLSGCEIGDYGCSALAQAALTGGGCLLELCLDDNQCKTRGCQAIASCLETNKTLTFLSLSGNRIGVKGANALAMALRINSSLIRLDLRSDRSVSDEGAASILGALVPGEFDATQSFLLRGSVTSRDELQIAKRRLMSRSMWKSTQKSSRIVNVEEGESPAAADDDEKTADFNQSLTWLDLAGCDLGKEAVDALRNAVKFNDCLTSLSVEFNFLSSGAHREVAVRLPRDMEMGDSNLLRLSFAGCRLGGRLALAFAGLLPSPSCKLLSLNLAENGIGGEAAGALARSLESNCSLQTLDLSANPLGPEGMAGLAISLQSNRTLRSLSLAGCTGITCEMISFVRDGLMHNGALRELSLAHVPLAREGAELLSEVLMQSGNCLRALDLRECSLGVMGGPCLASAVAINSELESLLLAGNNLRQVGGLAFAAALRNNSKSRLKKLDLSFNGITPECVEALSIKTRELHVDYSANVADVVLVRTKSEGYRHHYSSRPYQQPLERSHSEGARTGG